MPAVQDCVASLEAFIARNGLELRRSRLPEAVHGRLCRGRMTLHRDLSGAEQLQALVHELAHWLTHTSRTCPMHPTVFEYEAEAVEAMVMQRLGLSTPATQAEIWFEHPTDGLLPASLKRVTSASEQIYAAITGAAITGAAITGAAITDAAEA